MEREKEKRMFIANYFSDLFRTSGGQVSQHLLDAVETKIMSHMNECLMKEFTSDEMRKALDGIGDLKAPGPEGMP